MLNPVTLTKGARECFEIGNANLASHLRRAIGADVEAFASPEERVLEAIPDSVRGAVSKEKKKRAIPSGGAASKERNKLEGVF